MARKRLSPAAALADLPDDAPAAASERPPIARVVGDAAGRSELLEVAEAHRAAREEGRLIVVLPLEAVDPGHLVRDRMVADDAEMAALKASIAARGQQTPIEVQDLGEGRYGLISGWRRLEALKALLADTGEARFGQIKSLIRDIRAAPDAYIAMVEENEIRANLSFYERARIAHHAAERGVFPTAEIAVRELFRSASRAKRSKVLSFLRLYRRLEDVLAFPTALSERQGLALAKALEADAEAEERIRSELEALRPETPEAEAEALQEAMEGGAFFKASPPREHAALLPPKGAGNLPDGIETRIGRHRVELVGRGVNEDFVAELQAWLTARFRD